MSNNTTKTAEEILREFALWMACKPLTELTTKYHQKPRGIAFEWKQSDELVRMFLEETKLLKKIEATPLPNPLPSAWKKDLDEAATQYAKDFPIHDVNKCMYDYKEGAYWAKQYLLNQKGEQ